MSSLKPLPIVKKIVAFLASGEHNQDKLIGTAFLLYIEELGHVFSYYVTCKHVVKPWIDKKHDIYIRLNRPDRADVGFQRTLWSDWHYHKNETVDIAVLPLIRHPDIDYPPLEIAGFGVEHSILSEKRIEQMGYTISEGDEVFFVGLFPHYSGRNQNIPVVRFGRITLVTNEFTAGVYGNTRHYFIESLAHPGNSGAPLFVVVPQENLLTMHLYGVITGFFPFQPINYHRDENKYLYTHTGISIATPIQYVRDVLYSDKLRKLRREGVGAGTNNG